MEAMNTEQADGKSKRGDGYHQFLKIRKRRIERRRAKRDPGCQPLYGKYEGWET